MMNCRETLEAIYLRFKPMEQTVVWGSGTEVCVGWQHTNGYMRWYVNGGTIHFEIVSDLEEADE